MTVPTATYFKLRSIVCLPFGICGFQRPLALSFGTDRRTERRIDRESRLGMDQTHCSRFSMSTVGIVQPRSRPARRNPSKDSRKPQETIRSSRRNVPFDTRRGHRDRSQERLCGPRAASTPRTYRPRNLGLAPRHFPNHEIWAVSPPPLWSLVTSPPVPPPPGAADRARPVGRQRRRCRRICGKSRRSERRRSWVVAKDRGLRLGGIAAQACPILSRDQ